MAGQRGRIDSRLGELSAQLAHGDSPVETLEQQRQIALEARVLTERARADQPRIASAASAKLCRRAP